MEKSTVLAALTFVTLIAGMAVAAYQLWVTEDAKKKGLGGTLLNRPSHDVASKDVERGEHPPKSPAEPSAAIEKQPT